MEQKRTTVRRPTRRMDDDAPDPAGLTTPYVWVVLNDAAETTIVGAVMDADYRRFEPVRCLRLVSVRYPGKDTTNRLEWVPTDGPIVIPFTSIKLMIEAAPPVG